MSDNLNNQNHDKKINEAVCIDTKRIYDSCVSKDCLEDLRVTFTQSDQSVVDESSNIKCCSCELKAVSIGVDDVPFNKGFYTVTIKYYFKLQFELTTSTYSPASIVPGYAEFEKKCILYGGEGSAKMFSSSPIEAMLDTKGGCGLTVQYPMPPTIVNPVAKLQAVDPVVLDCELVDSKPNEEPMNTDIPAFIIDEEEYTFPTETLKSVYVTLGIFSIIQLERDVQMMMPAYDFCIPDKECCCTTQSPCDAFKKIDFPVDEFFPPNKEENNCCDKSKCDDNKA